MLRRPWCMYAWGWGPQAGACSAPTVDLRKNNAQQSRHEMGRHVYEFRDISYSVAVARNQPKCILAGISATICSGQVLAIMGPSGAGKTTLLDVITLQAYAGRAEVSVWAYGCVCGGGGVVKCH